MRTVRLSRSFYGELATMLRQGLPKFGAGVVAEKRARVFDTIENYLVHFPKRRPDPVLGICAAEVKMSPFVILYDYDDSELRVHLVIHRNADRTLIDLSAIAW